MLRYILSSLIILSTASAVAQEATDTTSTKQLQEIVISAPTVIRKADMDVYHPSRSAVENSKNGMQLLRNLMIPSLSVNDVLGSISSGGENVQVRINGRVSDIEQVKSLLPETIKRVEWIDNPGLRYGNVPYVLNFIITNPTIGGSLMTHARTGLNTVWGDELANAKFNIGKSQWEIGAFFKPTVDIKSYRDYSETFTWPDGRRLSRTETPLGGKLNATEGSVNLAYNYIKPDTTIFYVQLKTHRNFRFSSSFDGLLSLSDGENDIMLYDKSGSDGTTPRFSAYLEQHFAHRQTLAVDFNASLYAGHAYSDYRERNISPADYIIDVSTSVKDRNRAYGIETDYIKQWNSSKLTAGISYSANRNRSLYENLDDKIFHQRQDNIYFFSEYFHRLNKLTFTAGVGAQHTSFSFRESGKCNRSWHLRPQATVTYSINRDHKFRLSYSSSQSTPSLAETNIAPQQLDGFQWRIGNPDLKTSLSHTLKLRYSHNMLRQRISGSFTIGAFSNPGAITPYLYWDNDRLITSYENSKSLQHLSFQLAEQVQLVPRHLILSGSLVYKAERMRGHSYTLYNYDWSCNAALMFLYRQFQMTFTYIKSPRNLRGEKITWKEDFNIISALYNWKKWQFEAGVLMPFGKYDSGSKLLSHWNRNEQHTRIEMRIPFVGLSYNLQWGHQKRSAGKLINADTDVDHTTTGSR